MPRDPRRQHDAVHLQAPPEAAADEMAVKADLFGLETQGCQLRHRAIACLGADPDLALALAPIDRAIHRLEGRVGEKWLVIDRIDVGRRAPRGLLGFSLAGGHPTPLVTRALPLPPHFPPSYT